MNQSQLMSRKLEFGPRELVPESQRGCVGCKYFKPDSKGSSIGLCTVKFDVFDPKSEKAFWFFVQDNNVVTKHQGRSCGLWEKKS